MQGDLRNMKDVAAAVAGADCVWHAAWFTKPKQSMYGILTYICHKNMPFMWVNIPCMDDMENKKSPKKHHRFLGFFLNGRER